MSSKVVAYYRVSTQAQGKSGLGLEAQREAVTRFAAGSGLTIAAEFVEVETGKGSDALERRPQLAAALSRCKKEGARLVVAKTDRLSRDVHFVSGLMIKKGLPRFIDAELGMDVDPLIVHIRAAIGEHERRMISQRTRAALAAARERGVALGSPTIGKRNKNEARQRAAMLRPYLIEMKGLNDEAAARELNRRKVSAARGGAWSGKTVSRVRLRLGLN